MILSQIAAMAENRVIGRDNDLPWDVPEDLKYFKEKTQGHAMIMGRKTFESIMKSMGGKPLPNRFHVVVSRQHNYDPGLPDVEVVHDIESAIHLCESLDKSRWGEEVFVAGGAEIYKQTMAKTDRIYLTIIHDEFEGDTFFPEFDTSEFKEISREQHEADLDFSFLVFERQR
jgi:dihydrofolate reductase